MNTSSVAHHNDSVQSAHDLYGANLAFHRAREKYGILSPEAKEALEVLESVEREQGINHLRTAYDYFQQLMQRGLVVYTTVCDGETPSYRVTAYELVTEFSDGHRRDHVVSRLVLVAHGKTKLDAYKNAWRKLVAA
jgi:hypothetical protein